jgi:hypothetical protein
MKRGRWLVVGGILVGAIAAVIVACGDDSTGAFGPGGYGPGGGPGGGGGEGGAGSVPEGGDAGPSEAEILYRALEPTMIKTCGGTNGGCHVTASAFSTAPKFLAGPDSYVSIKGYPGIVVPEVFQSIILTKGQHEGPSIANDVDFERKVEAWLNEEALELQQVQLPTTDPFPVTLNADNDVDLAKLEMMVTGVHLKFKATLVGTSLELSNVRIVAPAGTAVHVKHPVFHRIAAADNSDQKDPNDSFSNSDQVVPGGAETLLTPGLVIFTAWPAWKAGDKMRLELYKLEPGMLMESSAPVTCKDPDQFGAVVSPLLTGMSNDSAQLTCTDGNCHGSGGDGQGAMDLSALLTQPPDFDQTCTIVLKEINKAAPDQSRIVQKPAGSLSHVGGKVDDPTTFTADWVGFIQDGGIF